MLNFSTLCTCAHPSPLSPGQDSLASATNMFAVTRTAGLTLGRRPVCGSPRALDFYASGGAITCRESPTASLKFACQPTTLVSQRSRLPLALRRRHTCDGGFRVTCRKKTRDSKSQGSPQQHFLHEEAA